MKTIPLSRSIRMSIVAVCATLCWTMMHAVTPVNPQSGQPLWTIVANLCSMMDETAPCKPTQISNADASGGVITISSPGHYCVVENLTNRIVINTDDVVLNLNNHNVAPAASSVDLITVNTGRKNITVHNGTLLNSASPQDGDGVRVEDSASQVHLKNIKIIDCQHGALLNGNFGGPITACSIFSCDFISSISGIVLDYTDQTVVQDCCAVGSTQAGFEVRTGEANCFIRCSAVKTVGNTTVAGFKSRNGSSNMFQECVSKGTKTSAWEFCNKAYGFLLTGTEQKTKIINCIVNETDVTSTVSAVAYGIHLDPILLEGSDLLYSITNNDTPGNTVFSAAWSPDDKYIVSGDNGNYVRVFSFDGSNLTHIDDDITPGSSALSVAWSPDEKYIASGDSNSYVRTYSFDGSNITYITGDNTPVGGVWSVAWSPNGKYIVSGDGNYVRVFSFDGSNLTYIAGDNTPGNIVRSVAWSPDGNYIVSGDDGNYVRVFSFDGSNLTYITGNNVPGFDVYSVAWSPDGNYIVSGDIGNYVRVFSFDGAFLTYIDGYDIGVSSIVYSVAWSPDGKYILSGDAGNYVRVFSFDGSNIIYITGNNVPGNNVQSVAWSPDGNYIVSGDQGNYVRVFDAMYSPQNCLIQDCTVCDTAAYGRFVGTGITTGGNNYVLRTKCCNNEVNFSYGIPNVFYGDHNAQEPFDNISMPTTQ